MKKSLKIIFLIIGIIALLTLLDSVQALLLSRSPIIRYHYLVNGSSTIKVVDKGILVNTYYCNNGNVVSVFKGFDYSCITDNPSYTIEDTTKKDKDFVCPLALEEIYQDDDNTYYLPCVKGTKIIVTYKDGSTEDIKVALAKGNIAITDLDKFGIKYLIK